MNIKPNVLAAAWCGAIFFCFCFDSARAQGTVPSGHPETQLRARNPRQARALAGTIAVQNQLAQANRAQQPPQRLKDVYSPLFNRLPPIPYRKHPAGFGGLRINPALANLNQLKDAGVTEKEQKAIQYINKRMRLFYPRSRYQIDISPLLLQYPGNPGRPVTGQRPVALNARVALKKGNLFQKLWHSCKPDSNCRFYIDFDANSGQPLVVEQANNTIWGRLNYSLGITEKIHDFFHSSGVQNGIVAGGLGAALAQVSGPACIAAFMYAGKEIFQGLERRDAARRWAVDQTATWSTMSIQQGVTPTCVEAFNVYKDILENYKPGTAPGRLEPFLNRLARHHL